MRRRSMNALVARGLAAASLLALALPAARATDDMPVVLIEFNDGQVNTKLVEVPAGTRFRLEIVNKGATPAEFESRSLGVEIVIPPGATRARNIPRKMAGRYPFFDDFHMETTQGAIIIK